MTLLTPETENYLERFADFRRTGAPESPEWLRRLRDRAFARFCQVGFPTTRDEDWRFTNVAPLARTDFRLFRETAAPETLPSLDPWELKGAAARLVFVNGRFSVSLSTRNSLPAGVVANGLQAEIARRTPEISRHLGQYLDIQRDPFSALNTAFIEDGAYVHVTRGVVLQQPIHLLFVSTAASEPTMINPRNLVLVDQQAQATIVEEYISIGAEAPTLANAVTEMVAGENTTATHIFLEREHRQAYSMSTLRIEQARSANVASHSFLLGGLMVRNNVHPVLAGEGGECLINGLFLGNGRQHLDNYMLVEHASPHCASRQYYNGILDDHAHGVFHGRIIVHKDAQKTDAKQTNRNLLLSDDAQIDTKPQLEIYADDVKCTHGATIGQIEENALFYLRSRGMSEADARRLLLEAFAGECLDRIQPGAARSYVEAAVRQRLANEFTGPAGQLGESAIAGAGRRLEAE
jgi:Fe-S cluster assembly protein SufD